MQDTETPAPSNGWAGVQQEDETNKPADEPSRIYHGRRDIPPPPRQAEGQVRRRERWVKLPTTADFGYQGWFVYMWTNFPAEYINTLYDLPLVQRKDRLNEIFLAHNGWKDERGNEIPQPSAELPEGEPDFWDAIPQEVANELIQLMNVEQKQLSFLVQETPRASRRS